MKILEILKPAAKAVCSIAIVAAAALPFSSCNKKPDTPAGPETTDGHEMVDLGLSVKWATCNIGADKPEDFGDYFAWGEIQTKEVYSKETYKFYKDDRYSKYNSDDNKSVLDPEDDVAHVKWGDTWRMPTRDECKELVENCTWTWVENKKGMIGTSKINGNSIFLPANGNYISGSLIGTTVFGHFWSSTPTSSTTGFVCLLVIGKEKAFTGFINREYGKSIRPVTE